MKEAANQQMLGTASPPEICAVIRTMGAWSVEEGVAPYNDILPIVVLDEARQRPTAVCGTGFLVGDGILVTAWHCVRGALPAGQRYIVCRKRAPDLYDPFPILDIAQHPAGRDLALCHVPLKVREHFKIFTDPVKPGMHVWTFGYPATHVSQDAHGELVFHLGPRYLEGYITRGFVFPEAMGGPSGVWELDMQVPGGLSGAPLFFQGTDAALGVVFHAHEVETVETFRSIDPVTGKREPEVVRVIQFGLAHPIELVLELQGQASGGRVLRELM
ncbi:MAG: serine protease [bacterium]|uniref:Serine protease n=1 Tax=Candidatus Methylomirabilis tolerans TaxID=3123416 RepID=A0AAJ1AHY5_9BACT|nr:serine protease [Candidatus Methylomirabilis sp.]